MKDLVRQAQSLENLPNRYPVDPNFVDAPVEYRFLTKWNYKIIYTVLETDKTVLVVLVFDTRQDPKQMVLG